MAGATGCLISLITSILLIRLDHNAKVHDTKMIEEQTNGINLTVPS